MKRVLISSICILLLASCSQPCDKKMEDKTEAVERLMPATTWINYDEPMNGYKVSLQCKQVNASLPSSFYITIILKQGDNIITEYVPEAISLERMFEEDDCWNIIKHDTTIIHNTHKEMKCPFFDCNNIVYFEDIDFDGKDELIVCTYPWHNTTSTMDCETYLTFEVYPYFLYQSDNRFTRRIAGDLCRTEYYVNKDNRSITLIGNRNACESIKEVYWFKDGRPYKLDYTLVIDEEESEYHFMIDSIDAFIDSIKLSRYELQ